MQIAQIVVTFRNLDKGLGGGSSAYQLLELATINLARVIGMEKEIGSIEPGKKADLILINLKQPHLIPSLDPVADLVYFGKGSDVDATIIDGKVVYAEGEIKTLDENEVLEKAQVAGE